MTTANDLIVKAQYNYQGDAGDSLVTTAMWQNWFNQSQQDLYRILRDNQRWEILLRGSGLVATASAVIVTNGKVTIPGTADTIIAVSQGTNDTTLTEISFEVLRRLDNNPYMQPWGETYSVDWGTRSLYVRPTSIASVEIKYTIPPEDISNFSLAYTTFPPEQYNVLSMILTTYAFASEEDIENVSLWAQSISSALSLETGGKKAASPKEAG